MQVFTLCMYAQQDYAYGHVGLCMYVCIINIYVHACDRKYWLFGALWLKNLLNVFYCYLAEFKLLQCGFLRPVSCTDRAIHAFSRKAKVLCL